MTVTTTQLNVLTNASVRGMSLLHDGISDTFV